MSETKMKKPGRVKSAVLKWLGAPISLTDGEFWGAWNGSSAGGKPVTVDCALQLSTVWACVRLISETISTLPLGFYEKMPDGSRRAATDHPLYELLHSQPNADMTAVQFWEAVIASMLLWGNAYIEKARIGKRVVALNFLLPQRMQKRRLTDGSMEYKYLDLDGKLRVIAENDLVNIPAFSLDGVNGLTPMAYGAKVFGAAHATNDASAKVYSTGMRAAGFLKVQGKLDKDQREALRERLKTFTAGGPEAGTAMVLENGTDYTQLSINPNDSQMLESRQFAVEEICRWFRTPPSMVGHGGAASNWGTGIEQQMIGFLTFALRPIISKVEHAIRKSIIEPGEKTRFFAEFGVEGLLRADSAARAQFYSTMTQNGIYTRNEVRQLENMPRMDGGDELTVQSNMIPLSMLGKITSTAGAAKNALLDWLGLKQDGEAKHEA
jgi:HK97 family phage portal protein